MSTGGCGLKNSGCLNLTSDTDDGVQDNDDAGDDLPTDDSTTGGTSRRFVFVDGRMGFWSSSTTNYPSVISCPVGGIVVFYYRQYWHDLVELPDEAAYDACDVRNATVLSPTAWPSSAVTTKRDDGTTDNISYYYHCSQPNTTAYLTCSVPGHCQAGQKVQIYTSATENAYNETTQEWNLHVESIARLLRLLHYHEMVIPSDMESPDDNDEPLFVMDHGFQTEALASQTLQLIWCALDHCPSAAWDVNPTATVDDCESMIYTLMGYVSRKRPVPQWTVAHDYYDEALARGGSNWCVAASYLAQWYWTVPYDDSNYTNTVAMAQNHTMVFCQTCATSDYALIRQARLEFDRQVADGRFAQDAWPEMACGRPPSSGSTSFSIASGSVSMLWFMASLLGLRNIRRY